jgi:CheY-like chemotaxis protein
LVVDDDADDLRLLERMLEEHYQVRKAHGGLAGLTALQEFIPHAVILDLFMPDMDGFTLLEKIRSDTSTRDIPVIVFTAGDVSEEEQMRLSKFSQEMISKSSFSEEDLLELINKAIKKFTPGNQRG